LHSFLELGNAIGRYVDDYEVKLDWSTGKDRADHPLLDLIARKISGSTLVPQEEVWNTFFPDLINNQRYFNFILNSSYCRPRDIVRLLRVAREFQSDAPKFTTEHFDQTSTEYSRQTWLEVTEELLAVYSPEQIEALQRFFLGFKTHFLKVDLVSRVETRYRNDWAVRDLFSENTLSSLLANLYRIGVVGNDFIVHDSRDKTRRRHRWIFRGNARLNEFERMAIHKSLWKHLTLIG